MTNALWQVARILGLCCAGTRAGFDDSCASLPTYDILWLCDSRSFMRDYNRLEAYLPWSYFQKRLTHLSGHDPWSATEKCVYYFTSHFCKYQKNIYSYVLKLVAKLFSSLRWVFKMIKDLLHINNFISFCEIKWNGPMSPIYIDSFSRKKCRTQFIQVEMWGTTASTC